MTEQMTKMVDLLKRVDSDCKWYSKYAQLYTQLERAKRHLAKRPNDYFLGKRNEAQAAFDRHANTPRQYEFNNQNPAETATLLYAIRAHCRKRLHMRIYGKYDSWKPVQFLTLDNQAAWIDSRLKDMDDRETKWKLKSAINADDRVLLRALLANPPEPQFAEKMVAAQ